MNFIKLLLPVFMLTGTSGIQAQQRQCDMAVTLLEPAESAVIAAYAPFNVTVNIANDGPDDLIAGDTLYYNTASMPLISTLPYILSQPIAAGSNATITLTTSNNTTDNGQDETLDYYIKVISSPANNGSFIDTPHVSNNRDQHTITFKSGNPTAIQNTAENKITLKLYPNPAAAELYFDLYQAVLSATVNDMSGREVLRSVFSKTAGAHHKLSLDVSGLMPGIYLVQIHTDQGRATGKFIKK